MVIIPTVSRESKQASIAEPTPAPMPEQHRLPEHPAIVAPHIAAALLRFAEDNRARRRGALRGCSRGGGYQGQKW